MSCENTHSILSALFEKLVIMYAYTGLHDIYGLAFMKLIDFMDKGIERVPGSVVPERTICLHEIIGACCG